MNTWIFTEEIVPSGVPLHYVNSSGRYLFCKLLYAELNFRYERTDGPYLIERNGEEWYTLSRNNKIHISNWGIVEVCSEGRRERL